MSGPPATFEVACPTCESTTFAVIPSDSKPLQNGTVDDDEHDGKVWTTCSSCDERFLVYYRNDS